MTVEITNEDLLIKRRRFQTSLKDGIGGTEGVTN